MWGDFTRALGQMGERRFRRVVGYGIALALALLLGVYAGFLGLIELFVPEQIEIPFVGPIGGLDTLLGIGSLLFMLGLSVFLMVPVAALFSGLFLEQVAGAVEAWHYPHLPPAPGLSAYESLKDSLNFLAVLMVVNLLALLIYPFAGPLMPVVFWAVNGFLLGREYFTLVAARRLGRAEAKALRRRHSGQIWLAGALMAAPLSVPLVNLVIPVLGVATFAHMVERLRGTAKV